MARLARHQAKIEIRIEPYGIERLANPSGHFVSTANSPNSAERAAQVQ
jgi:hypothetical protein